MNEYMPRSSQSISDEMEEMSRLASRNAEKRRLEAAAKRRLPMFIVLKCPSDNKYLTHLQDDCDYLQFSGTDFGSLHNKYQVVAASKNSVDGLVHLKCCYNNKYWVCRPNQCRISADALEMEEDQTKRLCTLFKPVFFAHSNNLICFRHVNINKNVIFSDESPFYMTVDTPSKDSHPSCINMTVHTPSKEGDYIEFTDWTKLPILPRFIALKLGENYLSAYKAPQLSDKTSNSLTDFLELDHPLPKAIKAVSPPLGAYSAVTSAIKRTDDPNVYLRFNCKDKGEQTVGNEVFITPDGKIRLKSNHTGKFWRRSPNWIWPDSDDVTNDDPNTLFEVENVSQNKIALRNLGGDKRYCESLSTDGKNDCLNASSTTVSEKAKFLVEELVDKRNIFNVRFHEKDVRIYEKEIMSDVSSIDVNNTGADYQATIEFEYTKEESRTWTTSNELKQTAEVKITAGSPDVVGGELRYAREVTETVTNGKTLNEVHKTKFARTVTVQPNCRVVANFRVMKSSCDIPYSYTQTETLTDGTTGDPQHRDDGLYTSVRTEVHFNPTQEKILC